tara:strand:+ start:150 stop:494 length:345 start_codon:yes stop_codon:yes gene_type:complete
MTPHIANTENMQRALHIGGPLNRQKPLVNINEQYHVIHRDKPTKSLSMTGMPYFFSTKRHVYRKERFQESEVERSELTGCMIKTIKTVVCYVYEPLSFIEGLTELFGNKTIEKR